MITWPGTTIHPPRRYFSFDLEDESAPVAAAPVRPAAVLHATVSATLYFRGEQGAAVKEALRLLAHHRASATHAGGTDKALHWLQFSLPRQFVTAHAAAFQALFVDCARMVRAECGAGGCAGGQRVDWLTVVDVQGVTAAGGLPALRSALPRDWFAKYDYGNGIVIQAGPAPFAPDAHVLPNLLNAALRRIKLRDDELLQYKAQLLHTPRLAADATLPEML